jgi:hypothetical protein
MKKMFPVLVFCLLAGCASSSTPIVAPVPRPADVLTDEMLLTLNVNLAASCAAKYYGKKVRVEFCACTARTTITKIRSLGIATVEELRRRHSDIQMNTGDAAACLREAVSSYIIE